MLEILDTPAYVGDSYSIQFDFVDHLGDDVIPTVLSWTLKDSDGDIINSREDVSIVTPAATVYVQLSGDDLVADGNGIRYLVMSGVAATLPLKQIKEFVVMSGDPTQDTDPTFLSYVTLAEMETYFYQRLGVRAFDNASQTDRLKAGTMSTSMIDRLNFHGEKADSDQSTEFPRGGDSTTPQDIKDACCEIILALLEDVDINLEYDSLAMISDTFLRAKSHRDTGMTVEHIVVGIPSRIAWQILKPYVMSPNTFNIHKTS